MGSWNATNAQTLTTDETEWPIWKVGILLDLQVLRRAKTHSIEYKYILVNNNSPSTPLWEAIHGNRVLVLDKYYVGPAQSLFIDDVYEAKEASLVVVAGSLVEIPKPIRVRRKTSETSEKPS